MPKTAKKQTAKSKKTQANKPQSKRAQSKKIVAKKTVAAAGSRKKTQKSIRLSRLVNMAGVTLVIIGMVIAGFALYEVWHNQHSAVKPKPLSKVLNNKSPRDNGDPLVSGTPIHITVPSVGIDLKVIPGYYYPATKSWTLSPTDAQYAVMTAKANNKSGDTFIYAHAREHVFGSLPKIKSGEKVILTTDSGHTFTYEFQSSTVTTPDDTSLFKYKGKPILILQTCSGAWWQNRQLFVFNLSQVS